MYIILDILFAEGQMAMNSSLAEPSSPSWKGGGGYSSSQQAGPYLDLRQHPLIMLGDGEDWVLLDGGPQRLAELLNKPHPHLHRHVFILYSSQQEGLCSTTSTPASRNVLVTQPAMSTHLYGVRGPVGHEVQVVGGDGVHVGHGVHLLHGVLRLVVRAHLGGAGPHVVTSCDPS